MCIRVLHRWQECHCGGGYMFTDFCEFYHSKEKMLSDGVGIATVMLLALKCDAIKGKRFIDDLRGRCLPCRKKYGEKVIAEWWKRAQADFGDDLSGLK